MLPRRVSQHVRDQNWAAVAIDFVIVVVGVFVGIQVSNWNTDRLDREREAVVLEHLLSDYREMATAAAGHAEYFAAQAQGITRVIAFLQSGENAPDDSTGFLEDLNGVVLSRSPVERSATFIELLSTGDTYLIRDDVLRTELVRVDQQHQAALRAYEVINDFWIRYSETIARKMIMADESSDDGVSVRVSVASYDLAAMREDPEVIPALTMVRRMKLFDSSWRRGIQHGATEILERLEAHQ